MPFSKWEGREGKPRPAGSCAKRPGVHPQSSAPNLNAQSPHFVPIVSLCWISPLRSVSALLLFNKMSVKTTLSRTNCSGMKETSRTSHHEKFESRSSTLTVQGLCVARGRPCLALMTPQTRSAQCSTESAPCQSSSPASLRRSTRRPWTSCGRTVCTPCSPMSVGGLDCRCHLFFCRLNSSLSYCFSPTCMCCTSSTLSNS